MIHMKPLLNLLRRYRNPRFSGAYASYQEAVASVRKDLLVGYDNDAVTEVAFDQMCRIALWDWPVLYWLKRLEPISCVLDVGGHMGTKFRAFQNHLALREAGTRWIVYDVPAMVRAGRERAKRDGLTDLSFIDSLSEAPAADVLLASGLLQYLDVPFDELIGRLITRPRYLILNKVATREGASVFTLENFGCAKVPYMIRNRREFLSSLDALGYDVVDEWRIPELSHVITTHRHLGTSVSFGYCAKLRAANADERN